MFHCIPLHSVIYWVLMCIVLHLHCSFVVFMMPLYAVHIMSTEHSIITQAASQWVLCFSGCLPNVLIYLWLIIFLSRSREINMMMMMIVLGWIRGKSSYHSWRVGNTFPFLYVIHYGICRHNENVAGLHWRQVINRLTSAGVSFGKILYRIVADIFRDSSP